MREGDGVVFVNFRNDRMRELSRAIGFREFNEFSRTLNGLDCITMTEYDSTFPFPIYVSSRYATKIPCAM